MTQAQDTRLILEAEDFVERLSNLGKGYGFSSRREPGKTTQAPSKRAVEVMNRVRAREKTGR